MTPIDDVLLDTNKDNVTTGESDGGFNNEVRIVAEHIWIKYPRLPPSIKKAFWMLTAFLKKVPTQISRY